MKKLVIISILKLWFVAVLCSILTLASLVAEGDAEASWFYGSDESPKPLPTACVFEFGLDKDDAREDGELASDTQFWKARYFSEQLKMRRIKYDLRALTGVRSVFGDEKIRDRFSEYNKDLTRKYIGRRLERLGYLSQDEVFDHGWQKTAVNVIGEIKGRKYPDEIIEVVMHYDSEWGSPGADDNGTGVTLGLEIARQLTIFPPDRTFRFIFSDLEESGSHGVKFHLDNLRTQGEKIVGAYIIDMIGYAAQSKHPLFVVELGNNQHVSQAKVLKRNRLLANLLTYQYVRYKTRSIELRLDQREAKPGTGDHGTYWDEGYPGLFISTPMNSGSGHNHKATDTIENMNWEYFTQVSKFIAETIAYAGGIQIPSSHQDAFKEFSERDLENEDLELFGSDNFLAVEAPKPVFKKIETKPSLVKNDDKRKPRFGKTNPSFGTWAKPQPNQYLEQIENTKASAIIWSLYSAQLLHHQISSAPLTKSLSPQKAVEIVRAVRKKGMILIDRSMVDRSPSEMIKDTRTAKMLVDQIGEAKRSSAIEKYIDLIRHSQVPPRLAILGDQVFLGTIRNGKIHFNWDQTWKNWSTLGWAIDFGIDIYVSGLDKEEWTSATKESLLQAFRDIKLNVNAEDADE